MNLPLRRVRHGQPETSLLVVVELCRSLDIRSRAKLPTLEEPEQSFPNSPSPDHDPDNQESRRQLLLARRQTQHPTAQSTLAALIKLQSKFEEQADHGAAQPQRTVPINRCDAPAAADSDVVGDRSSPRPLRI